MEALSGRLLLVRMVLGFLASLFIHVANAQHPVIDRLELAFAQGASDSVIVQLDPLLRDPNASRDLRFEACMLMAECYYQQASMENFAAWNDSAAAITASEDNDRWARVEVNRCRYANFFIKPEQALVWGNKALVRYRSAPDRSRWKYGYAIYQALGTTHRNIHGGQEVLFALFDTAQTLLARRSDVIPYWRAHLHKAISNAALDRLVSGLYDKGPYGPLCEGEQQAAIRILEEHYPMQLLERGTLQNLRGLYHLYSNRPDSALFHFQRSASLVGPAFRKGRKDHLVSIWLTCLRYQSFVLDIAPWRNDSSRLQTYLHELINAQEQFTHYLVGRTTAGGLFFDDQYWLSPYPAIMATCSRLWELTGDTAYVEQALRATEKSRRDQWNSAQSVRVSGMRLGEPPRYLLRTLQQILKPEEGILICAQNNVAGLRESVFLLAVTSSGVAFESRIPNYSIRNTADLDHKTATEFRRGYHALHALVYQPVAHVLSNTKRVHVFPSGDAAFIAFDALLSDTSGVDLRACGPLVQNHAFNYPLLLMQPEREEHVRADRNALYIAPSPGPGQLSDLKRMRSALVGWAANGSVDSAFTFADLQKDLAKADAIYLAGHCAGAHSREHQPRHYFGTDTNSFSIQPSDLLSLELNADLVVHLACRSGLFEVDRSGGGISFARAFLFAGASNVISSQYLADEGSSIKLISLFRNELAKGLPKDVAMQRAKLAYLEQSASAEEHMPLHWAGWQVLGEAEHMVQTTESPRWWLLVGGAIALLGLALYLKRR